VFRTKRVITRYQPSDERFEMSGGERNGLPPRCSWSVVRLPVIDFQRDGLVPEERLDLAFVQKEAVGAALRQELKRFQRYVVFARKDRRRAGLVETELDVLDRERTKLQPLTDKRAGLRPNVHDVRDDPV